MSKKSVGVSLSEKRKKKLYFCGSVTNPIPSTVSQAIAFYQNLFGFNLVKPKTILRMRIIMALPWLTKIYAGDKAPNLALRALGTFDVSPQAPSAAWNWANALARIVNVAQEPNRTFEKWLNEKSKTDTRVIVMGSGRSAESWRSFPRDNRVIICANSVVRSSDFLRSHSPDVIVAADALFHFSETQHGIRFRSSVENYLNSNSNSFFIFPQHFSPVVFATVKASRSQLVPIKARKYRNGSVLDFVRSRKLPKGKNIFDYIMLPLAASISKKIYLIGFDGKPAEQKTGLWVSPSEFEFASEKRELEANYPGFFRMWQKKDISVENFDLNVSLQLRDLIRRDYEIKLLSSSNHACLNSLEVHSLSNF
jgi:hypothetical protein